MIFDQVTRQLRFVFNGVDHGVAYIIPGRDPLYPAFTLWNQNEFIEFID